MGCCREYCTHCGLLLLLQRVPYSLWTAAVAGEYRTHRGLLRLLESVPCQLGRRDSRAPLRRLLPTRLASAGLTSRLRDIDRSRACQHSVMSASFSEANNYCCGKQLPKIIAKNLKIVLSFFFLVRSPLNPSPDPPPPHRPVCRASGGWS